MATRLDKSGLQDQRVVKLLLPLPLIRAMDRLLVEGVGGFSTRNEFVREAIESYMVDLTHEPAPEEPVARSGGRGARLQALAWPAPRDVHRVAALANRVPFLSHTDETALPPLRAEALVISGQAEVIAEPLFGMHNRDFPSLWAAHRLADYAADGVVTFEEFAERATEEAWEYAESLRGLERDLGMKLTALFPTNREKRQTASSAFRVFAIGSVTTSSEFIHAEGPLFLWRVIDVEQRDGGVVVGLTEVGRGLLARLAGLTISQPHPPEQARVFLDHLREHAPADFWGFKRALDVVAERPSRAELVEGFRTARPDWRESVAATNAQGYVARAREWGLVAPKVVDGRYELTALGAELAEGVEQ